MAAPLPLSAPIPEREPSRMDLDATLPHSADRRLTGMTHLSLAASSTTADSALPDHTSILSSAGATGGTLTSRRTTTAMTGGTVTSSRRPTGSTVVSGVSGAAAGGTSGAAVSRMPSHAVTVAAAGAPVKDGSDSSGLVSIVSLEAWEPGKVPARLSHLALHPPRRVSDVHPPPQVCVACTIQLSFPICTARSCLLHW
jgi:hypothetical protein